jgi:hypothetical protein
MGVLGTTNTNNGSSSPPGGARMAGGGGPLGGGGGVPGGGGMPVGGAAGGGARSNGPAPGGGLSIQGGAAIVAPVSAFPGGIPQNALIVLPLAPPTDEFKAQLDKGPVALTPEQMWKLLGFNGPAVQVQDDQGRPIAIGLEDLVSGLQ